MKKILQIFTFLTITIIYSQNNKNNNWQLFSLEKIISIDINKTESFVIKNLKFEIVWDNKLTTNLKFGYLGGIKSMKIYIGKRKFMANIIKVW